MIYTIVNLIKGKQSEKSRNEKGFGHIELIIGVTVVFIIIVVGIFVATHNRKHKPVTSTSAQSKSSQTAGAKTSTTGQPISGASSSGNTSSSSGSSLSAKSSSTPSKASSSSSTPSSSSAVSTDPTITITSPSEGQIISGSQYTLSCNHTTPSGYQSAEATIQNNGGTPYISGFSQGSIGNCSATQDATSYPNGNYTITFTVTDNAGKTATAVRHFTIQH